MSDLDKNSPGVSYEGNDKGFVGAQEKPYTTVEEVPVVHDTYQEVYGYEAEHNLAANRNMFTLLFQTLSIAAIPYGIGSALISAYVWEVAGEGGLSARFTALWVR